MRWNTKLTIVCVALAVQIVFFLWPLTRPGLIAGHDTGAHVVRIQLFTQALREGQFPVRWTGWVLPGNDSPLFSYCPPLFYYLTGILMLLGMPTISSLYLVISGLTILSVVGWFGVGRRVGSLLGGVVAASFSLWFPYHLSQLYVRFSLLEFAAASLVPFVFWGVSLASERRKEGVLLIALSLTCLLTTHQPTLLMLAPVFLFWGLWEWVRTKDHMGLAYMAIGAVGSVLLSASFLFPLLVERAFIHEELLHSSYYDFHRHFVTVGQLLRPMWGYGLSLPGSGDGMSFQVGIVTMMVLCVGVWVAWKKRDGLLWWMTGFVALAVGMMLPYSLVWWERFGFLAFLQYPWRYLVVVGVACTFLAARLATYGASFLEERSRQWWVGVCLGTVLLCIVPVWGYRAPATFLSRDEFSLTRLRNLNPESLSDPTFGMEPGYVPASVTHTGIQNTPLVEITSGKAEYVVLDQRMDRARLQVTAATPTNITLGMHWFPRFEIRNLQNGKMRLLSPVMNEAGYMELSLPQGESTIEVTLKKTPVREIADAISLVSILIFLGFSFQVLVVWKQGDQRRTGTAHRRVKR